VARWNVDSVEAKQDAGENLMPVKPNRLKSGKRIDGMVAAFMAIDGWMRHEPEEEFFAVVV
jgi:phage terminase large subunit-like protein